MAVALDSKSWLKSLQFPPPTIYSPPSPDYPIPTLMPPPLDLADLCSPEISTHSSSSSSHNHQTPYYTPLSSDASSSGHDKPLLSLHTPHPTPQFISIPSDRHRSPPIPIPSTNPISPPTTPHRLRSKLRKLPPYFLPSRALPTLSFVPNHQPPSSFHFPRSNTSPPPSPSPSLISTSPHFLQTHNPSDFSHPVHSSHSIASATISTSSQTPLLSPNPNTLGRFRRTLTLPSRKLTKRRPTISSGSYAPLAHGTASFANLSTARSEQQHTRPAPPTTTDAIPGRSNSAPTHNFPSSGDEYGNGLNVPRRRSTLSFSFQPSSFGFSFSQGKAKRKEERRKSSAELEREWLPPMKAMSPFQTDIPTHTYQRDSSTSSMTAMKRSCVGRSTDALAELAWMGGDMGGTAFMLGERGDRGGWRSTWSSGEEEVHGESVERGDVERSGSGRGKAKFTLGEPENDSPVQSDDLGKVEGTPMRPRFVRRDARVGPRRRWTLAMAMTDEGITDEVLVEELEKMRMRGGMGGGDWEREVGAGEDGVDRCAEECWIGDRVRPEEENGDVYGGPKGDDMAASIIPSPPSLPSLPSHDSPSSASASASWKTARRALLTCRELVRTERHYLSSLRTLLSGHTSAAPPPLMLRYAGELVRVSEGLLGGMEADPSAWGVAGAFLGVEEGVEGAFVAWCGVVGGWFVEGGPRGSGAGTPGRRLSKRRVVEEKAGGVGEGEGEDGGGANASVSPLKRTVSTWRRSMPSLASLNVSGNGAPIASIPSPISAATFLNRRKEREKEREKEKDGKRRPSVRDLAILPTQRVMRYVLLYRDLLAHTPATSPSRALVERAVDAACRIAQKCDRAQGNGAFLRR